MSIKTEQLLQALCAYPGVGNAILYTELMACSNIHGEDALGAAEGDPSAMKMVLSASEPPSPARVRDALKEHVREELALGTAGSWADILVELDSPVFLVYLAGKMGAM